MDGAAGRAPATDDGAADSAGSAGPPIGTRRSSLTSWLREHCWPLIVSAVLIATTIAYVFWGDILIRHKSVWLGPGDLWDTYRAAQWVAFGNEGTVYEHGLHLVTFPAIVIALAPVGWVAFHFHMTDPYPYAITRPTALPLLLPYVLVSCIPALLALDHLAQVLGVPRGRRAVLCWVQGALMWPLFAIWGHPEDVLGLMFATVAMSSAFERRWVRAAWCLGFAVAFQPFTLVVVPLVLALVPPSKLASSLVRSVVPSAVVLALPLIQAWHATTQRLLEQPNYYPPNYATPLLALAPRLAKDTYAVGPWRTVVVVAALVAGGWIWVRRPRPELVVWTAALLLLLRFALEPIETPFYPWAASAVILALAATRSRWWFAGALALVLYATAWARWHIPAWQYWLPLVASLGVALAFSFPVPSTADAMMAVPALVEPSGSSPRAPHLERDAPQVA